MRSFTLKSPAKINGRLRRAGEVVELDDDIAGELGGLGLIGEDAVTLTSGDGVDLRQVDLAMAASVASSGRAVAFADEERFDQAVAAKAEALAGVVTDELIRRVEKLQAERDAALEGVATLNRRVEELEAEVVEAQIAQDETLVRLQDAQDAQDALNAVQGNAAAPDQIDTPPSEPAEEAVPKKGAAAKAKG